MNSFSYSTIIQDNETTSCKVAVVIVNFLKASRVVENLYALRSQQFKGVLDIIVLDNSESNAELQTLRQSMGDIEFTLLRPKVNIGYTKGCNVGCIYAANSDFILLLNPDIIMDDASVIRKLTYILTTNPSIGAISPNQINDDGSIAEIARPFPTFLNLMRRRLPFAPRHKVNDCEKAPQKCGEFYICDSDWLQSSCLLLRRYLWDSLGGLNERYFLFMSDIEICYRIWQKGFRVCLVTDVQVRADGRRASSGGFVDLFRNTVLRRHLRDALRFYRSYGARRITLPR